MSTLEYVQKLCEKYGIELSYKSHNVIFKRGNKACMAHALDDLPAIKEVLVRTRLLTAQEVNNV